MGSERDTASSFGQLTMESPNISSPIPGSISGQSSRSRSSIKLTDDIASLTSFNPFSEEDENDQSSFTLVTSIFSRMKSTLSAPLSSVTLASNVVNANTMTNGTAGGSELRRPSYTSIQAQFSSANSRLSSDRPHHLVAAPAHAAPPLVSLTPAQSEVPTYTVDYDRSSSQRGALYSSAAEPGESALYGTSIPGFPIQDDARSIKTTASLHRSGSVSKVIRRIRGEGEHY